MAVRELYKSILDRVHREVTDQETDEDVLRAVCKRVLGKKFAGVYAADDPGFHTIKKKRYAILNASKRQTGGTHWYAVCRIGDMLLVSDSFGRDIHQYCEDIPNLTQNGRYTIRNTDRKPEQKINQNDCGARSISWLMLCDIYGPHAAKLI